MFTFSFMHLHLQKVVEAASTLLDRPRNIWHWKCHPTTVVQTGNMSKFVFSGVDSLMFDNSNNDAADVYKAQSGIFKKMEYILIQKMGDTG